MYWNHFRVIVSLLLIGNILSTIVVYRSAGGDDGWWPMFFLLALLLSLLYSAVFSAFAKWKKIGVFPACHVHIGLALVSFGVTVAYYNLGVDWLAVNRGADLSGLQKIVHSDSTVYLVHFVALVLAMITGFIGEKRPVSNADKI